MPRFEVKDAAGKRYEVTAPDVNTAMGAWQKMQGQAAPAAAEPVAPDPNSVSDTILPFSGPPGNQHFDSNAGVLGMAKGIYNTLSGGSEALTQTAQGAPVTTDTIDKTIALSPLAIPTTPGLRAGEGFAAAMRAPQKAVPAAPSTAALFKAGGEGFDKARGLGVDYTADSVAQMASTLKAMLHEKGILPEDAPSTYKKLDMLANPPPGSASSFAELDSARKAFGEVARNFNNPTDQKAATAAIRAIEHFYENPTPASVLAGPAAAVADIYKEAKGNWAAGERSKELVGREAKAIRRTQTTNSGKNLDNKLRQRVADLLDSEELSAGFSPDEKAALDAFTKGTFTRNTARSIGNNLGGGGGLASFIAATVGGTVGGAFGPWGIPVGIGVPYLAGTGAKSLENALAKKALRSIDASVRKRSPLYRDMQANAPLSYLTPEAKAIVLRALALVPPGRSAGGPR
jgi:hypothetical protein